VSEGQETSALPQTLNPSWRTMLADAELPRSLPRAFPEVLGEGALVTETVGESDILHFC